MRQVEFMMGRKVLAGLGLIGWLLLSVLALWGPLWSWPGTDEANYLLQSWRMAQGEWPYRDFFEFVTPGGQWVGSLWYQVWGHYSTVGMRLVVVSGWLVQMALVWQMARVHLPRLAVWLLVGFLWVSDLRYPIHQHHFWSGLAAVVSVYAVWRYLACRYAGQGGRIWLMVSGVATAWAFWCTQSLGILLGLALLAFSALHCILHEREETNSTFGQLSNVQVWHRWCRSWGTGWAVPGMLTHALVVGVGCGLGLMLPFWRDSGLWLWSGAYAQTTIWGYFSTFHAEFAETLRPLADGVPMPWLLLFLFRIPIAVHVFLIGLLPVIGLVGAGLQLPGRFMYRLLQREDESLLLFFMTALAMMLSTFSYSTSMHIVSNGAIAFLLGAWVVSAWAARRPRWRALFSLVLPVGLVLVLLGGVVGSVMMLALAPRMPAWPGTGEALLYTTADTSPQSVVSVVSHLHDARRQERAVLVFSQSPALYLASQARNATRYTLILPKYTTPAQQAEVLADVQRHRPLYVVDDQSWRRLSRDHRFRRYPESELALTGFKRELAAQYELMARYDRFVVYRRRE